MIVRLTEQDIRGIVRESVKKLIKEEERYIDRMIRLRWQRFDMSNLKPIFDNLGLKRGGHGFSIGGDSGYISLRLDNPDVEFRAYNNGKVFACFDYDKNAGAWGGYSRECEITDPDVFKNPKWFDLIKRNGAKKSPDIIMRQ